MHTVNKISPTFCAAKWRQITIDLFHGVAHSCHHTKKQPLNLDDIKNNLSAFHNTIQKKHVRNQMLNGIRPKECDYCWKIEDIKQQNIISDRFIKSSDNWANFDQYAEIIDNAWEKDISPTYVEVMFNSICNFSCMYCAGHISSSVAKEIKQFGEYKIPFADFRSEQMPYYSKPEREEIVGLFLQWIKKIICNLHYLRITGGEPLLSKELYLLLTYLQEATIHKNFTLAINSNLGIDKQYLEKFINHLTNLEHIPNIELFISVDTWGKQAEFIRAGLNYEQLLNRVIQFKNLFPKIKIIIMCTFNIISFFHFDRFLKDIKKLKMHSSDLVLDIAYLNNPPMLSPNITVKSLKEKLFQCYQYMKTNKEFTQYEAEKLKRIIYYCDTLSTKERFTMQMLFLKYIRKYAKRNNFDIVAYLPELDQFKREAIEEYKLDNR